MRRLFGYEEMPNFPPRYNIAPTQPIPIVRAAREAGPLMRHFALARWGFLPGFVKDPKAFPLVFNARSEGLADKASFRNALRRRRCLVPADAFYEWRKDGAGGRTPFLAKRADGVTMALAGLWETWCGPNGEEVDTACIVTTQANRVSSAIHPRLPVVIEEADFATWLDPDEATTPEAAGLLRPPADDLLVFVPIGDAVNKASNDDPRIQVPVGLPLGAAPTRSAPDPRQASLF
jgi:putative SOS response-associated peptidase YedK